MSITYVKYMTPTFREAKRIGLMAKRLHGEKLSKCVMLSPIDDPNPTYREPQYGHPRVQVHWLIATRNKPLAYDDKAWDRAVELYETRPYWIAWLQSVCESRFGRKDTK